MRPIRTEAIALFNEHGGRAYALARERARTARLSGDIPATQRWSKIAVEVASLEGRDGEIGVKGSDRYGPR